MVGRYRDGKLPALGEPDAQDTALLAEAAALPAKLTTAYDQFALQDAATLPIELARSTNTYIDRTEPFKLAKDEAQAARLDTVLHVATHAVHAVLAALLPILPTQAAAGLKQLNTTADNPPTEGHQLGTGEPLFPRVDPEEEPPEPAKE
jgi:methionyl-tRNA synthetase